MAYDEFLADRIKQYFKEQNVNFEAKKMMGGLCFMVDGKMCCGIHFDKKKDCDLLMARVGEDAFEELIDNDKCHPMDFTGRPMKGYTFVTPNGFDADVDLAYYLQKCLDFNPKAKKSLPKKKKSSQS